MRKYEFKPIRDPRALDAQAQVRLPEVQLGRVEARLCGEMGAMGRYGGFARSDALLHVVDLGGQGFVSRLVLSACVA